MQTTNHEFLWKKFLYYNCKQYVDQISSGEKYHLLNRNVRLIIFSCDFLSDNRCTHNFVLMDEETYCKYKDSIEIHTIEIKKNNFLVGNNEDEIKKESPSFKLDRLI